MPELLGHLSLISSLLAAPQATLGYSSSTSLQASGAPGNHHTHQLRVQQQRAYMGRWESSQPTMMACVIQGHMTVSREPGAVWRAFKRWHGKRQQISKEHTLTADCDAALCFLASGINSLALLNDACHHQRLKATELPTVCCNLQN